MSRELGPRRILFARAADAANHNAQAKNVQNILSRWQSTDYRPSVFAFGEPDPGVAANPNVDILQMRDDRWWTTDIFAKYMGGFDAVFCPGIHHTADWLALRARAALGRRLPIITTAEVLFSTGKGDQHEVRYAALAGHAVEGHCLSVAHFRRHQWIYRSADHIVAISPFLARQMQAEYGDKVSMVPLGVDRGVFTPRGRAGPRRPRVLSAASVGARKRPEVFLALATGFPDADFVWFGEGDLRQALAADAAQRGLGNVTFRGLVNAAQLAAEMAASDVLVLPSHAEGVPKVTQEAAAVGLPQIVFGFYEAPTVIDGRNGYVVWSDKELRARLGQLLVDASMRDRMGGEGMRMAERWSWDTVAPLWEQRIVDAAGSARREARVLADAVQSIDKAELAAAARATHHGLVSRGKDSEW